MKNNSFKKTAGKMLTAGPQSKINRLRMLKLALDGKIEKGTTWGGGWGEAWRFDFQKFCLFVDFARVLNHLIVYKKKTRKRHQILNLKTVWTQNGQFYYIKS